MKRVEAVEPILRYYPSIFQKGLRKNHEETVARITSIQTWTGSHDLSMK
jgi:hypothetical protein